MTEAFLSQIRLDGGTQMRADLSKATVATYAEHIRDGAQFPPVVVFHDGKEYWLADGFHRFHAYKEAGKKILPVDIRTGQRIDAIRYALSANATNGRPRSSDDMRRSYQVAVSNGLCDDYDSIAVQSLLGCSSRWARELTRESRESLKTIRDDRIVELASEGKSQREIAVIVEVDQSTIARMLDAKRNTSEMHHPDPDLTPNIADLEREEIKQRADEAGFKLKDTIATKHTGDEESYTPTEYLESARAVLGGIDLDPASNDMAQKNVKAGIYYTAEDDGLCKDWSGRVWLNPPYTALVINRFIEKLISHVGEEVSEAIVLTNNNTDTSWFHSAAIKASAICFTRGRINFLKRDGSRSSPTNGQSFFYFGDSPDKFRAEFAKHGLVMVKA